MNPHSFSLNDLQYAPKPSKTLPKKVIKRPKHSSIVDVQDAIDDDVRIDDINSLLLEASENQARKLYSHHRTP